jgi:hypothetical protein
VALLADGEGLVHSRLGELTGACALLAARTQLVRLRSAATHTDAPRTPKPALPALVCAVVTGLLQHMPGLGVRAIRYSMLVDDGTVVVLNIEEPGASGEAEQDARVCRTRLGGRCVCTAGDTCALRPRPASTPTHATAGGKSYKTSGPGHMLEDIAALNKGQQG